MLNHEQVRSSIARRLGIKDVKPVQSDRNVDAVVEMMLDATQNYEKELTPDRLFDWLKTFCGDTLLKAAIAHFWFVTIHPFDDGNGRIARTISDMILCQSDRTSLRFYSMSNQIMKEKNRYYEILEITQKGSLDITLWRHCSS